MTDYLDAALEREGRDFYRGLPESVEELGTEGAAVSSGLSGAEVQPGRASGRSSQHAHSDSGPSAALSYECCDFCTRPGPFTVSDFGLRFCLRCNDRFPSLVAMLEQKHGAERAKEMLA